MATKNEEIFAYVKHYVQRDIRASMRDLKADIEQLRRRLDSTLRALDESLTIDPGGEIQGLGSKIDALCSRLDALRKIAILMSTAEALRPSVGTVTHGLTEKCPTPTKSGACPGHETEVR